MSLLGIYVIIGYYQSAKKNPKYHHKITHQELDVSLIQKEIDRLLSYRSDALHWNCEQLNNLDKIAEKALKAYHKIEEDLNVKDTFFEKS